MIEVEVAYALPERQRLLAVRLEEGATVGEAIERSGILVDFPEAVVDDDHVGIFGKACALGTTLKAGDRVEIYRALIADPKEARRKRARG